MIAQALKPPKKMINHIWVFSDSIKGHEVQSMAVANELSDKISLFHCTIRQPWLSFAPRILPRFGRNIIWQNTQPEITQNPDIIITCGRRMAAVGKYYKRQLNCKHIQILNPGDSPKKYDLLICPEHDRVKGDNVITTQGSLHSISVESLAKIHCPSLSNITTDTVAVLLGNPGKLFFNETDKLALNIDKHYPMHKVIICGSRRTPKKYHTEIERSFKNAQLIWLSEDDGKNPYMDLLACSQVLVVSADSINMVSEACATDKPVIIVGQKNVSPKHKRFINSVNPRLSNFGEKPVDTKPLETIIEVKKAVSRYF